MQADSSAATVMMPPGGKGMGKGGKGKMGSCKARRFIQQISKPHKNLKRAGIRKLARRAGIKRISGKMYEEVQYMAKQWLENVMNKAFFYTDHARRTTINEVDVDYALRRFGIMVYGPAQALWYQDGKR